MSIVDTIKIVTSGIIKNCFRLVPSERIVADTRSQQQPTPAKARKKRHKIVIMLSTMVCWNELMHTSGGNKIFTSVATPAFYGYSGSSLTVSQNIAKTVNTAQKLARRQKIATIYPAI